jgi:hypothetical protein
MQQIFKNQYHNCISVIDEKHTNDHICSFLGFLYNNMIDLPTNIVLLSSNMNRVGSMGRGRCSCNRWVGVWTRVGASVREMTLFSTSKAPPINLQQIRSSLGPLSILISSSRGLEILGALNHLPLWGTKSLSNYLRPRLRLWLSKTEHWSSCRCSNT